MSSRKELINQIKEQRKIAKAQLLYNAGITKLKKSQLSDIAKQLKEINNAMKMVREPVEKEYLKEDKQTLETEKQYLLEELEDLKNQDANVIEELEELDINDDEEDYKDEEAVDRALDEEIPLPQYDDNYLFDPEDFDYEETKDDYKRADNVRADNLATDEKKPKKKKKQTEYITRSELKKRVSFDEFEDDSEDDEKKEMTQQYGGLSVAEGKHQIEEITGSFKNMMMEKLKELKRFKRMNLLTDKFVNETIDYHNYYRGEAEKQITNVLEQMIHEDFPKGFYTKVNKVFETVLKKMEKALS